MTEEETNKLLKAMMELEVRLESLETYFEFSEERHNALMEKLNSFLRLDNK